MATIRDAASIAQKWADVTPTKSQYYQQGVQSTQKDWATLTSEAQGSWAAGVQDAIAGNRFSGGVTRAGTAKWKNNTLTVGVPRWPQGIANGKTAFQTGIAKYVDVIRSTQLPPRGPKGSPQNQQRSNAMAMALHQARISG